MEDAIASQIKQALASTKWSVGQLERISGGNANFTYRGHPEDGGPSIFIKHSENFSALNPDFALDATRSEYEWFMLSALTMHEPAKTERFLVQTPRVLGSCGHTKMMEDLPGSTTIKAYLSKYGAELDDAITCEIGTALGRWLAAFHGWIDDDTSEARSVRDKIKDNPLVPLRANLYMGSYSASMQQFPTEVKWPAPALLAEIEEAVYAMYQTPQGGIHGDFWTGNMIIKDELLRADLKREDLSKIFIVDFEVAQLGTRAQDLAQCLAELWMIHHFYGERAPLQVMHGFVEGYGVVRDEKLALQIAMHIGIHVVVIPWRYNAGWKGGEPLLECIRFGNECLIRGFQGDVEWFKAGSLGFLFPS